jgi:hypothetical protein
VVGGAYSIAGPRLVAVSGFTMMAFAPSLTSVSIWVFCRLALAAASSGPSSLMCSCAAYCVS